MQHVRRVIDLSKVVYDALQACSKEICETKMDQELRKSYLLSYQKYKEEMKKKAD